MEGAEAGTLPSFEVATRTSAASAATTSSSAEVIFGEIKKHQRTVVLGLVGLLIAVSVAVVLWMKFAGGPKTEPFRTMKIERLTTGGRIGNASIRGYTSISPDGKYVVFRTTESGKDSLWLRQVSSGSLVKIVPDVDGKIGGTTFSRDGELIFYSRFDKDDSLGTLYSVPVLGFIPPTRIMSGVTSPVTFSPDGKQIAFVRPSSAESALMAANIDGSGERKIAVRKLPDYFALDGGPSWSPDGERIACGAGTYSGNLSATIVSVPAAGGPEKPLTSQTWVSVSRALWLSDGSGLIVAAVPRLISAGTQLWHVAYPGGGVRRVTNDLNAYGTSSLGLTADSKTLVTVQADKSAQIWVVATDDATRAKQITNGKYDGDSLSWTPDGRVLYTAPSGEQLDIWSIASDGTTNRQLTTDAYIESLGCVSSDGAHIVFSSNRSGSFNLWRLDSGASDQKQLTQGPEVDSQSACSPDGQWVLFRSFRQGKSTFWKVPMLGGTPEQVVDKSATWAAISPDGKFLALRYFDDQANRNRILVMPFAGGPPITILEVASSRDVGLGWTPDSKSVTYADSRDQADNIWSLPLDGGPPKQLTNFSSGLIFAFQMSRDGKQIALSRGSQTDDVILLRDAQ